ncbi:J domain-containing protein [Vibrio diazotrophicus]|uniref:J domain-containing protein n=1 Tax=Vibrio diazotrophicus TaxID=685 RepID=UPI00142D8006|nr:tetratricopeptide repeat protein [Vibrio diazotrophicus]NIY92611.1 J domain-containing protein [Vibrio diazotrophicus]
MNRLIIGLISLCWAFSSYADTASAQIAELKQRASNHDAAAQYQLALHYQKGEGTPQDLNEAFYWFQQASEKKQSQAMHQLAKMYLQGLGTELNTAEGIYWLIQLATQGDTKAQYELGKLYQTLKNAPTSQQMAEIWFRTAAESLPEAEQAYTQILEDKFNQQRAKQVSAIDQLNNEAASQQETLTTPSDLDLNKLNWAYVVILASIALLMLVASLYQRKKRQKLETSASDQLTEQQQLEQKLADHTAVIKKQKRQLEILYQELKRSQKNQASSNQDQKFQLACSVFGYHPSQLPDEKAIKVRYKQLSKIYHPDMKGSDEEMKRLNGALKTILNKVNN